MPQIIFFCFKMLYRGRVICTVSRAKKVIFGVYSICFVTTITTPFEWTVEVKTDPFTNTSKYEIASSTLGKEKIYRTVYYWFTTIIFVKFCIMKLNVYPRGYRLKKNVHGPGMSRYLHKSSKKNLENICKIHIKIPECSYTLGKTSRQPLVFIVS